MVHENAYNGDDMAPDEYEAWNDRCPVCGCFNARIDKRDGNYAEVVNKETGARGLAHVECFLGDRDCYELA